MDNISIHSYGESKLPSYGHKHSDKQLLGGTSNQDMPQQSYEPLHWRRLPNLQNSCFLNASLQMIVSAEPFRDSFDTFCRDAILRESSSAKPFVEFINFYTLLLKRSNSNSRPVKDRQRLELLIKMAHQRLRISCQEQFPMGRMQDANEFFLWFLSIIDSEVDKYISLFFPSERNNTSEVGSSLFIEKPGDLLKVKIEKCIVCDICGFSFNSIDKSHGIQLSLCDSSNALTEMLNIYFGAESVIHSCECGRNKATVYSRLDYEPDVLLLTLKRWKTDGTKSFKFLKVPFSLSLRNYASSSFETTDSLSIEIVQEVSGPSTIPFKKFSAMDQIRVQKILHTMGPTSSIEYPMDDSVLTFGLTEAPQIATITPDGNCFFTSLSWWFYNGETIFFDVIREQIVEFIEENASYFEHLLPSKEEVNQHIRKMKKNGKWATSIEIIAAATLFHIDLYTYLNGKWTRYSPLKIDTLFSSQVEVKRTAIYLDNRNGNHFSPAIGKVPPALCMEQDDYVLHSVACHSGSSKYGHYIALTFEPSENCWYEWNDDKCKKMELREVTSQAGLSGYMLLYTRRNNSTNTGPYVIKPSADL